MGGGGDKKAHRRQGDLISLTFFQNDTYLCTGKAVLSVQSKQNSDELSALARAHRHLPLQKATLPPYELHSLISPMPTTILLQWYTEPLPTVSQESSFLCLYPTGIARLLSVPAAILSYPGFKRIRNSSISHRHSRGKPVQLLPSVQCRNL